MKKIIALAFLTFSASVVFASVSDTTGQKKDEVSTDPIEKKHFLHDLKMRQSFQTDDAQKNPAQFMLSIPQSGRSNWLIDGGISLGVGRASVLNFKPIIIAEFHRNTLVDSAQYNFQVGFGLVHHPEIQANRFSLVQTINAKYSRDVTKSLSAVNGTYNVAFYSPDSFIATGLPHYFDNEAFYYQFLPSAEMQIQQYLGNDTHTSGIIARPTLNLPFTIGVNAKAVKGGGARPRLIELAINYINRYAIIDGTGDKEGYTKELKTAINYYFIDTGEKTVSIGGGFNLGSDPLNGLKSQQFWQFALQVQL